MGILSNNIRYRIDPTNIYEDDNLSFQTVNMLFSNVDNLECICNFNHNYCLQSGFISINGEFYHEMISKITYYNLYNDLRSYQLIGIHNKLNKFIEENEKCLNDVEKFIEENDISWADNVNKLLETYKESNSYHLISHYSNLTDNVKFIHPQHIKILCQLFKVMSENNLCLTSSF